MGEMSHAKYSDGLDEIGSSSSDGQDDSWDNEMSSEGYNDGMDGHAGFSGYNQNVDQTNYYTNNFGEGQGYGGYLSNPWTGEYGDLSNEDGSETKRKDVNRFASQTDKSMIRQKSAAKVSGQNRPQDHDHWSKEMSHAKYSDGLDEFGSSSSDGQFYSWDNEMSSEGYNDGMDGHVNRFASRTDKSMIRQKSAAEVSGQNRHTHPYRGQGDGGDHSIVKSKKQKLRKLSKYDDYMKSTEIETNEEKVATHALHSFYPPPPVKITQDNLYGLGWGEWGQNPISRYSAARQKIRQPGPFQFFNDPFLNDGASNEGHLFNRLRNLAEYGFFTGQWKDSLSRQPSYNTPHDNNYLYQGYHNQQPLHGQNTQFQYSNQKRGQQYTNQQNRINPQHAQGSLHQNGQLANAQPPKLQNKLQQQRPQQPQQPQKKLQQQRPPQQTSQHHKMLQQQKPQPIPPSQHQLQQQGLHQQQQRPQQPLQSQKELQQRPPQQSSQHYKMLQQQQRPQQIPQSQYQMQQGPQPNQLQYAAAQHGLHHHLPLQQQMSMLGRNPVQKPNFPSNLMQNMQNPSLPLTNLANFQQYNHPQMAPTYPYLGGMNFGQNQQNPRQQNPKQNPQGSKGRNNNRPQNS